jgi:hypothetical protein
MSIPGNVILIIYLLYASLWGYELWQEDESVKWKIQVIFFVLVVPSVLGFLVALAVTGII